MDHCTLDAAFACLLFRGLAAACSGIAACLWLGCAPGPSSGETRGARPDAATHGNRAPGQERTPALVEARLAERIPQALEPSELERVVAPALPAPAGSIVRVSSESQLQSAVQRVKPATSIVIAPGVYVLAHTLVVNHTRDVTIRGATDDRDDVVIAGPGMRSETAGAASGIWTGDEAEGVVIANLTLRDFPQHAIVFNRGTSRPLVHNVHLLDIGQQFIKANPDGAGGGVRDGVVEYSVIEYTATAKDDYTNGIDVHTGARWIIRHNLFRRLMSPPGLLAGPAVLMWNHARDTITEGDVFIDCARGISYGLIERRDGPDHVGGVIRNNIIFRAAGQRGDAGIMVADSPGTRVLNNTVFLSATYPTPIEYRFPGSAAVVLSNNLLDGAIRARDGATAIELTNVSHAGSQMFVNAASGDLRLSPSATAAIDRGTALDDVVEDWKGMRRPSGAGYDIGADELGIIVRR
jgi:hypothetical protein